MSKRIKIWAVLAAASAALIALDLLLKSWAAANFEIGGRRTLIEGFLGLRYHENTGAAFGFLGEFEWSRWVLTALKILLMAGLLVYYNRLPLEKRFWFARVPIILTLAGGAGNLIDRVMLGHVRDMLEFQFIDFAIFNLADVYVTTGVFALIFVVLFIIRDIPFP